MIIKAEIISQPYSGIFKEKVYDIENSSNSQDWTFIKFTEDDYSEWCGQFRGFPKSVQISKKHYMILILTSDYLFQIDSQTAELKFFENKHQYQSLIVTPSDDFLIADYMNIEKISDSIRNKKLIESPIEMDFIEFQSWNNSSLEFKCDEFIYWDRHYVMEYNDDTEIIKIKNIT